MDVCKTCGKDLNGHERDGSQLCWCSDLDPIMTVFIDYTNWKGVRRIREIRPLSITFASSEWHTDLQWLLEAVDIETGETKKFSLKDIHSWTP